MIGFLVAGLLFLVVGAEALVRGASKIAAGAGISPLVVGLTVVAFGMSAPEMAVSLGSSLSGQADLALGNVVGSNIFNVLFILGAAALAGPLVVDRQLVRLDVPLGIVVALGVLAAAFVGYTAFQVVQVRRAQGSEERSSSAGSGQREPSETSEQNPTGRIIPLVAFTIRGPVAGPTLRPRRGAETARRSRPR